jgi:hypothetical protein
MKTCLRDDSFSWDEFCLLVRHLPGKSRVAQLLNPSAANGVTTYGEDDDEAILGFFSSTFR